ncbi:Uncharacterised protein [Streptococcus pneumoniae]|nr:hypothetical protein A85_10770 [Streptococcus pyogenes]CAG6026026.1 Uncharacterised protein [Streptococcus pneumoniae]CAG6104632.1 Uncharacterised protein [Streptococcus pneumoniae]CAG6129110.1 Uncharacterised protein [Streptococcus pneumoniae]CAG6265338.1 Uncharacterised protein [Streptococcus pneumoniae]
MIDRSYLPFQSAREYQDTKMQKWMGFFLSEHTSALTDDANKVTYMSDLSLEKKLLLLSQVYAGQLNTRIHVVKKKQSSFLYWNNTKSDQRFHFDKNYNRSH